MGSREQTQVTELGSKDLLSAPCKLLKAEVITSLCYTNTVVKSLLLEGSSVKVFVAEERWQGTERCTEGFELRQT